MANFIKTNKYGIGHVKYSLDNGNSIENPLTQALDAQSEIVNNAGTDVNSSVDLEPDGEVVEATRERDQIFHDHVQKLKAQGQTKILTYDQLKQQAQGNV